MERWLAQAGITSSPKLPAIWTATEDAIQDALLKSEMRPYYADLTSDGFAKRYQANALLAAVPRGGGHFWLPPGAGKTFAAAAFAFGLQRDHQNKPEKQPIICLTRTGPRFQFRDQLVRFADVDPFIVEPRSKRRKRDRLLADYLEGSRSSARPVLIVGWGSLTDIWDELEVVLQHWKSQSAALTVVFDEEHTAKQPKRENWSVDEDGNLEGSRRKSLSSTAALLAEAADRRLGLTGTPIRHRPWDLWGQLTLVEPGAWGRTATAFKLRHCDGQLVEDRGLQANGLTNVEELRARMSFTAVIVPFKVTHAELPPKRRELIRVPASSQAKDLGDWKLKSELDEAASGKSLASEGIAHETGEHQAALGGASRLAELKRDEAEARKVPFIIEDLAEYLISGHPYKIILFVNRIRACERLAKGLQPAADHAGAALWMAHGESHTDKEREAIRKAYMAHPGPCLLIGTWQAWGESYDMQDCDINGFGAIPLTPGEADQAEGRTWRLGSLRNTEYRYYFAEFSIDEGAARLLRPKVEQVDEVLGGASSISGMGKMFDRTLEDRDAILAGLVADLQGFKGEIDDDED